jgi:hypothetical protein
MPCIMYVYYNIFRYGYDTDFYLVEVSKRVASLHICTVLYSVVSAVCLGTDD